MLKKLIGCTVLVALFQPLAQAQQRIEQVGPAVQNEIATSTVDMRTDILTAARTIFPSTWSGFAQKGLDVHRPSKLHMSAGEPWVTALDRWLAQEQLSARLDWNARRFYLRAAPSMGSPAVAQYNDRSQQPPAPQSVQGQGEPVRTWTTLVSDVRLETTLERWSREAGYKLVWDADRQILISAADQFNGTLSDAINRVLSSPAIRDSDYPLEAVFYANNPPVIRITRLGDQPVKE